MKRLFDYLKEYNDIRGGRLYYKDFVDKYHFTYLIVDDTPGYLSTSLKHDDDNVVDTSISLTSEGDNISVDGDSFVLDVPAGYQNSVNFGMLSITVKKGEGQKLAAGSYNGSVVVNMNAT